MGRFAVEEGEIVDTQARHVISPDQFNRIAKPHEKQEVEQQLQSSGLLETTQEIPHAPSDSAQPSSQPERIQHLPSLEEFIQVAGPRNPKASKAELARFWNQTYGPVDPKALPTWTQFEAATKKDVPVETRKTYWGEVYGSLGASEHEDTRSDVVRGLKQSFQQLPQLGSGLVAGAGAVGEKLFGEGGLSTAVKEYGVKSYQDWSDTVAKESKPSDSLVTAYEQAKGGNLGALIDWMQYAIGYGGGQALQMLPTAGVGTIAGKLALQPLAKSVAERMVTKEAAKLAATAEGKTLAQEQLIKAATANVAGRIGQLAVVGAQATGMEGGEIFGDLTQQAAQEGRQLSGFELAKVFGATLAAGALEFVGDKLELDVILGRSWLNKIGQNFPGVQGRVLRGTAEGAALAVPEGATEFAQTLVEQVGEGKDPFGNASIREAIDSAGLGAVGGHAMGFTTGALTPAAAPMAAPSKEEPKEETQKAHEEPVINKIPDVVGVNQPGIGIDLAIQRAFDIVDAPTEKQKTAAADEISRMAVLHGERLPTAEEAARFGLAQPRSGTEIPILQGPEATTTEKAPLQTVTTLTPRQPVQPSPEETIASERQRIVAMRERAREQAQQPKTELPIPVQTESLKTSFKMEHPSAVEVPKTGEAVEREAHQAATSPKNALPEPTEAQKEVGNYKKGHVTIAGMDISIENPQGSTRSGVSSSGKPWSVEMQHHYGYIRGTVGKDKDHIDVFIKPGTPEDYSGPVFVVDQKSPETGRFDEHKTVLGAENIEEARKIYLSNYGSGWKGLRSIQPFTMEAFKDWIAHADKTKPSNPMAEKAPVGKDETITAPVPTPPVKPNGIKQEIAKLKATKKQPVVASLSSNPQVAHPRSSLAPEANSEMLLRAEKAQADLEVAGQETGRRKVFTENLNAPGQTVTHLQSAAPDWYRELTSGPGAIKGDRKQTARQKIEAAIKKIIEDEGTDHGTAVEKVKAAILKDTEFLKTDWGRDYQSILEGHWPESVQKPEPKPETPSHTETPVLETQPATSSTAQPQREPAITPKIGTAPRQTEIPVQPETVGTRPIIGREATPEEAPLFSKAAQEPEAEQLTFANKAEPVEIPKPEPTAILANALRTAADQIEGKKIEDVGEKIGGARKDLAEKTGTKPKLEGPKEEIPGWQKRYSIGEIVSEGPEKGKWQVRDTKDTDFAGKPRAVGKPFDTKEEAEAAIPLIAVSRNHRVYKDRDGKYTIYRKIGDRKIVQVVGQRFDTEDAAKRYMATHPKEILETKTNFGEEILPRPETVERIGTDRRNGRNVEADDFRKAFDFRAVEFGNWNNQIERQEVMNHAYDGLLDLADVLGIPPGAIGLNGQLALAFGARGHGLSGARAHYEPDYGVINLTKMKGAGSLAHEWFHAADHYFGRQDTKASSEKEANERGDLVYKGTLSPSQIFASYGFRSNELSGVRPEVREAYKNLLQTMFTKGEQYVDDTEKADRFVAEAKNDVIKALQSIRDTSYYALSKPIVSDYHKRNKEPATAAQLAEFDTIAQKIINGDLLETTYKLNENTTRHRLASGRWTNDGLDKISAIYKTVRGRSGFGSGKITGPLDELRGYMNRYSQRLKMLADAQTGEEKTKQVPTSYAMEAKSIDQGRTEHYWTTEHEMAARAFSAYVEDKLKAEGKKSDFITYQTNTSVETPWGWKRPYPEGEERQAINKAFDTLFDTLETKETDQGTALFSRALPSSDDAQKITELNAEIERREGIPNAFTWSPRGDQGVIDAFKHVFNVTIIPIRATGEAQGKFLAMQYRGTMFVDPENGRHGFVQLAGHELLHQLRRDEPELYEWFATQARDYLQTGAEGDYRSRLEATGTDLHGTDVREEILADFTGDALSDPFFLTAIAEHNPSKFRQFLNTILNWLRSVANKLTDAGFGSSRYFNDVEGLQSYLASVLDAYRHGGTEAIGEVELVKYARAMQNSEISSIAPKEDQVLFRRELGELTPAQEAALKQVHGEPETWKDRLNDFRQNWKKNFIQGMVDQYAPIKDYSTKAYMLARLAKGGEGTLEALLLYGKPYVDKQGAYRVEYQEGTGLNGFSKVLSALHGEQDRFLEWVAALRAERLKSEDRENLYDVYDIAALKTLNEGTMKDGSQRKPAYNKALLELNEWNAAMVKIAVESGLISEDVAKLFKDAPYVPFYRVYEEAQVKGFSVTPGMINQYFSKRLKGGKEHLHDDLLANLLQNWSHLITASAKNRAAKETLEAAKFAGAATEVPNGTPGKNLAHVTDHGTQRTFAVHDPDLLEAVGALHYAGLGAIGKPFAAMKRALTFGVTVNPAFKIRNLIRDTIHSIGVSELSYNPIVNIIQGSKGTRYESETRAQLLAGGGMIRFGSMLDGTNADRTRQLIHQGVNPDLILDEAGKIERFWKERVMPAFDTYQEWGDRGEQINRAALYQQLLDKGMSHLEASFWARDLLDFSLMGKWQAVRILTQVVPFMNARLQGLYKIGRATKEDYRKMGTTIGAVALSSIALMLLYDKDDDWQKREDWDRNNYWWFKIGDLALRIPKPFEIGAMGTLAERAAELMMSDEMTGQRFGQNLRDLVFYQLQMDPMPQLVKPMLDIYSNHDSFTQRPIETIGMKNLRKADRYTEKTSQIGRLLGQLGLPDPTKLAMGSWDTLSPVQIDSLLHGYFGWVGTSATTMLDYGIRPIVTRGEKPSMTLREAFLAGNFAESLPSSSSRYVTALYDQAVEIEQAYGSYRDALKRGDVEGARGIMELEREKIRKYRMVEGVKRSEADVNRTIRRIEADSELSGAEKRQRIDRLKARQNVIARRLEAVDR